jgi:hypothetical protein
VSFPSFIFRNRLWMRWAATRSHRHAPNTLQNRRQEACAKLPQDSHHRQNHRCKRSVFHGWPLALFGGAASRRATTDRRFARHPPAHTVAGGRPAGRGNMHIIYCYSGLIASKNSNFLYQVRIFFPKVRWKLHQF